MVTSGDLKNIGNKIKGIQKRVGKLATYIELKYFESLGSYYVVTRQGILDFYGDAQKAVIYGIKGKHYREFKNPGAAATFINTTAGH